ncbi:hypothetical protein INH39_33065 [Massilia violaceinigra]|uniref:Uncharacterized protein n=1 Tax=Massilia violaceinigra TaxID=2045208 RepID=A0ABY4A7I8_9BURK|nr:hypothetical protein [Massilia violaceinigra]UOD30120.1 hypothetical protein INH39_33065 [Massilia violaceinigra]
METVKGNNKNRIKTFIKTANYIELATSIINETKMIFCGKIEKVELEYMNLLLDASGLALSELEDLIVSRDAHFVKYCIQFIERNSELTQEQEYNPEELPNDEDDVSTEEYVCHSRTFLLHYAIYYLITKNHPTKLISFLDAIRTPHHRKYARALKQLYHSII